MTERRRKYKDEFQTKRNIAWNRARAQAHFRGETWTLSFEDFCTLWNEDRWPLRGRKITSLCMSRLDPERGWSRENTVLISRDLHLKAKNRRMYGLSWEEFYHDVITIHD